MATESNKIQEIIKESLENIRSIIDAENNVDTDSDTVRFALRPTKVHLFNKETGERIRFEV